MFCLLIISSFPIILCYANSLVPTVESRSYAASSTPEPKAPPEPWEHVRVACYIQPLPPEAHVQRLRPDECEAARALILVGDKTYAPMDFTHDEKTGYPVPVVWRHGHCQIILHAIPVGSSKAEDTFSFALVAHVASRIITKCLLETPFQIGGEAELGPKKIFEVVVAGLLGASNDTSSMPYLKNISSIHNISPGMGQVEPPRGVLATRR